MAQNRYISMNFGLDKFDKRILEVVQTTTRLSSEQLGHKVGLSGSAALKRLRRLREQGVIEREVALLSTKAVGRPLQMLVTVNLSREDKHIVDNFKKAIRDEPNIQNGYYITGDADFLLVVSAASMEDYEEFSRSFFYDLHGIRQFKTSVIVDQVKVFGPIPID